MYFSDSIHKVDFSLYEPTIDMILHALELYAYNLHYLVKQGTDEYYYCNMLILHAYNEILVHYRNNKYECGYNPIKNCQIEIDRYKRKNYHEAKNYYKKNIA